MSTHRRLLLVPLFQMVDQGSGHVFDLAEGITAWQNAGKRVVP